MRFPTRPGARGLAIVGAALAVLAVGTIGYRVSGERPAGTFWGGESETTLTVAVADSADPVAAGTGYNYTVIVTNTGDEAASSVSAAVTLTAPSVDGSSLTFVSASGTGWTCNEVAQVVTCTRATLAAGVAPTITIAVSPVGGGAASVSAAALVTASNVEDDATDNESTAITYRQLVAIMGQSNAVGQQWMTNVTNIYRTGFGAAFGDVSLKQKMSQTLADPLVWSTGPTTGDLEQYSSTENNNSGHDTLLMGTELTLGRHLDFYSPTSNFDIVKFAVSGTDCGTHWKPTGTFPTSPGDANNLFTQGMAFLHEAELELNGNVVAIVWIQGESDALDATLAAAYEVNLTAVFAAMNAAYPNAKILFPMLLTACTATHKATVRTAQAAVDAALSYATTVDYDNTGLNLTDGIHYGADSYMQLGDNLGEELKTLLGLSSPLAWTVDTENLLYALPANLTEWNALLAAAGDATGGPFLLWKADEASGDLADSIGSVVGTASGTGVTYQSIELGWAKRGLLTAQSATGKFSTTDASLPDLGSDDILVLSLVNLLSAPSTFRNVTQVGTTTNIGKIMVKNGPLMSISSGANVATGLNNPTGRVRPLVYQHDKTNTVSRFASDDEILTPTQSATVTGKYLSFVGDTLLAPAARTLYLVAFKGAAARKTRTNIKNILTTAGWSPPWTP